MTITSVGYDGTVDETQWAKLAAALGADYTVQGLNDFKVTPLSGTDRGITVAPGSAYGRGVLDTSDSAVTLSLATLTSGVRYDLIVLRRNWQPPGGTSSIAVVTGSNLRTLPGGRLSNPGVQDDQPLALVKVTAGVVSVVVTDDLRVRASKAYTAETLLALPDAQLGALARVRGQDYRRVLDSSMTASWQLDSGSIVAVRQPSGTSDGAPVYATGNRDLAASVVEFTPPTTWGSYVVEASAVVNAYLAAGGKYALYLVVGDDRLLLEGTNGIGRLLTRSLGGAARSDLLSGPVTVKLNVEALEGGEVGVYNDPTNRLAVTFRPATDNVSARSV